MMCSTPSTYGGGARPSTRGTNPLRDDRLLAIWSEEDYAFIEERRARPGDRAILLVSAWNRSDWINQIERIAVPGALGRYRSKAESDPAELAVLAGLPAGWAAIEFTVREDLSGEQFGPDWEGMLTRETYFRVEGGLLLSRRRWMAGAGLTLRTIGAKRPSFIWIDNQTYPLDEGGCVTSAVAPVLDQPGRHRAWLPGEKPAALTFVVIQARIGETPSAEAGWRRAGSAWPITPGDPRLHSPVPLDSLLGPRLVGWWQPRVERPRLDDCNTPSNERTSTESRVAIELLLGLRGGSLRPGSQNDVATASFAGAQSANSLLRGLARATPRKR